MRRISELKVLDNYRVWLRFDDSLQREVDFSHKPQTGVYAVWKDYAYFRRAGIDSEGQLRRDDQLDFSAESLWRKI
jgi:hypothetical protein